MLGAGLPVLGHLDDLAAAESVGDLAMALVDDDGKPLLEGALEHDGRSPVDGRRLHDFVRRARPDELPGRGIEAEAVGTLHVRDEHLGRGAVEAAAAYRVSAVVRRIPFGGQGAATTLRAGPLATTTDRSSGWAAAGAAVTSRPRHPALCRQD